MFLLQDRSLLPSVTARFHLSEFPLEIWFLCARRGPWTLQEYLNEKGREGGRGRDK